MVKFHYKLKNAYFIRHDLEKSGLSKHQSELVGYIVDVENTRLLSGATKSDADRPSLFSLLPNAFIVPSQYI